MLHVAIKNLLLSQSVIDHLRAPVTLSPLGRSATRKVGRGRYYDSERKRHGNGRKSETAKAEQDGQDGEGPSVTGDRWLVGHAPLTLDPFPCCPSCPSCLSCSIPNPITTWK